MSKLHEECGVFGIFNPDGEDVVKQIYYGLFALQHRGQESCGMAVNNEGTIGSYRDTGLVTEVFTDDVLSRMKGSVGIGHVRYSTCGANTRENAQPLVNRYVKGILSIAHNGSLTNAFELRQELINRGSIFLTTNDSEVITHLAAIERATTHSIEDAMRNVMQKIKGAYSLLVMSPRKLIGIRDPLGFRPLCIGKLDNSYVLASETCALDAIRAEFVRDVDPGEIVIIDKSGLRSDRSQCSGKRSLCVFEYIYFARPDSVIDGESVYEARNRAGMLLAKARPVEADVVIGLPESGLIAAMGYAKESGIPYGEGLYKSRYIGRTFINPDQSVRESGVHMKLSVVRSNIEGKDVIAVDDSIVRGTTTANIIKMLKDSGAKKVHLRISSPPYLWPCYYGTDVHTKDSLIATKYTIEELGERIGADSLSYLPEESLARICQNKGFCDACFTGDYPVPPPPERETVLEDQLLIN